MGRKPGTPPGFRAIAFPFTEQHSAEKHVPKGTPPGFRANPTGAPCKPHQGSVQFQAENARIWGNSAHPMMRRRYQKRSTPYTMDESDSNSSPYAGNVCDRSNNERATKFEQRFVVER